MKLTVKLSREELEKIIRNSLISSFELNEDSNILFKLSDGEITGVEIECETKKPSSGSYLDR